MEKAVEYTRVSKEMQGTERQSVDIDAYCKAYGYEKVETFSEKITGASKTGDRIQFNRMLNYIEQNNIKHIIISEISRLGRNLANTATTIQKLSDKKVCIHFLKESMRTIDAYGNLSSGSVMMIGIFSAMAQMELESIRYRVKSGLNRSRHNVGGQAGIGALGFKNVDKKLVVNEDERKIVEDIFQMYLEGKGSTLIAKQLNKEGIKPRGSGKEWSESVIQSILRNPLYKGFRRHNGELIQLPDTHVIIPPEKFDKVQFILTNNYNKKNSNRKYVNILSGKLVCGDCSLGLYLHRRPDLKDNAYKCLSVRYSYKSENSENPKNCNTRGVNIDLLNSTVAYHLKHQPSSKVYESKLKIVKVKMDRIMDDLKKEEDRRDRAIEMYVDGKWPLEKLDEIEAKINEKIYSLADQESALDDEYKKAIAADMQARVFGSSGESVGSLDAERLRVQVGSMVKQITINTIDRDSNPQYMENRLDHLHSIKILGHDEKSTTYILASGSKKVFCDGVNILTKPEPIFI